MNYNLVQWILLIVVLGFEAYLDIRYKRIYTLPLYIATVVSIAYMLLVQKEAVAYIALSLIPGLVMMILAYIFKKSIGSGDGLVIVFAGAILGVFRVLSVIFLAFVISAFAALVLLLTKKAGLKSKIPFVPFILLAAVLVGIFY